MQHLFTCSEAFLLGASQPARGHLLPPPSHVASALAGGCEEAPVSFQEGLKLLSLPHYSCRDLPKTISHLTDVSKRQL